MQEDSGDPVLYLQRDNAARLLLRPDEVLYIIQYKPKSGRFWRKVHAMPGDDGKKHFVIARDHASSEHAIYTDLNKDQWYLPPNATTLVKVPGEPAAYRDFAIALLPNTLPTINGHKALRPGKSSAKYLVSYLNNPKQRFAARSFFIGGGYSIASGTSVTTTSLRLPVANFIRYVADDGETRRSIEFFDVQETDVQAINLNAGATLPLTPDGKFDVAVLVGYAYHSVAGYGFVDRPNFRNSVTVSSRGNSHFGRIGAMLNYRFTGKRMQPFLGLGAILEIPLSQEHTLFNLFDEGNESFLFSLDYQGAYRSIQFPQLAAGVDIPITAKTWATIAVDGAVRLTEYGTHFPVIGLTASFNY